MRRNRNRCSRAENRAESWIAQQHQLSKLDLRKEQSDPPDVKTVRLASTSAMSWLRPSWPAIFSPLRPWLEYSRTISMLWAAANWPNNLELVFRRILLVLARHAEVLSRARRRLCGHGC